MQNKELQVFISAAFAGLLYYLGIVSIPTIMLIFAMIIDYATGMSAAFYNSELSSKRGVKGIVKKSRLYGIGRLSEADNSCSSPKPKSSHACPPAKNLPCKNNILPAALNLSAARHQAECSRVSSRALNQKICSHSLPQPAPSPDSAAQACSLP